MLKFIFSLLLIPTLTFSQENTVDDLYGSSVIAVKEQDRWFIKNFESGNVYLTNGMMIKGLIKFNGKLIFKDSSDDKRIKFKEEEVKFFQVGQDRFEVVKDFKYQAQRMWGNLNQEIGYLKSIIQGKASLYFNEVKLSTGTPGVYNYNRTPGVFNYNRTSGVYNYNRNYYIKFINNEDYVLLPPNKKKLKETLLHLFSDDQESIATINKINFKRQNLDQFKDLINKYNTH